MSYIAFTNQFGYIFGIFEIHFNFTHISQEKISELFECIQTLIGQPFKETGKLKVYESLDYIQNTLGECGIVSLDLNLDYYGIEYSENILLEWSETYEPQIGIFIKNNKFVRLEEEGSVSIFQSLLNSE